MDPVFTLPWPEFVVAKKLQKLLPKKDGFSIFIPLSRQEKGVDLAILHRYGNGKSNISTIQIKSSCTYINAPPKRKEKRQLRYNTWYKRFDVSDKSDFVILIGMYAPDLGEAKRFSAKWYQYCCLLFSRENMLDFLEICKKKGGEPDQMFGFGFDNPSKKIILNRGVNRGKDFSKYLLDRRIVELKK